MVSSFLWYSTVLRTLRQSKYKSIISQSFAVAAVSGGLNDFITADTVALKTWAARSTHMVECELSLMWS